MDILAAVLKVIGWIIVDFCIIIAIWLRQDRDEDWPETFFLIGFIVNTILMFALLTAAVANETIQ